ncbi:T9SS type B sorting domain-containing protein [Spongiivirga citrea]|uniref:T9SS type B sorting domain-containing protein n=1 Tax=Spongiivirga citrea TaxID=1481457 RepID=A0A6M0CE30_9FLAO|nr:T9SS type B sorting domain-containing protein [Spongiivirga citrea]NER15981.1 T9SS type B sorting domain-containing protein [Spongiivirga citrea]
MTTNRISAFFLVVFLFFYVEQNQAFSEVFVPPGCVDLTAPINGAVGVAIDTNITWEQEDDALGYRITVSTVTPTAGNIANNVDVGNQLFYDPAADLPANTIIFIQIIPYNLDGPADPACKFQFFSTGTGSVTAGVTDLVECEGQQNFDGLTVFDLTEKNDEISQGDPNIAIFYYLTEQDAIDATNLIVDPENFSNTINPQEIWYRAQDITDPLVFTTGPFNLVVETGVNANNVSVLTLPDTNANGINTFDLTSAYNQITNTTPGLTLQFFEDIDDAQNNSITDEIPNPTAYDNIANPQEVYVRVSNAAGCDEVVRLRLRVGCDFDSATTPVLNSIPPLAVCDDSNGVDRDDIGLFDLERKRNQIYTEIGLAPDVTITFHRTLAEAQNNQNPVTGDLVTGPDFLYVRVDGGSQGCSAQITELTLLVIPLPVIVMPSEFILCLNNLPEPLRINAPFGFDGYEWRRVGDNTVIETDSQIAITEAGMYNLTVFENSPFGPRCEDDMDFEVIASNIATVTDVDVQDIMDNNTLEVFVEGEGDYEYVLDNPEGTYQDSNFFDNVRPGFRTIYIRDKNGCGITEFEVAVIGYPRYFTPNADGFHDTWQIKGIDNSIPTDTKIYIFDRFGKFIKQIRTDSPGWDGLVDGKPYPSTDYWFTVELEDGRNFKGHFALKR